jgi:ankyrin repeat protein
MALPEDGCCAAAAAILPKCQVNMLPILLESGKIPDINAPASSNNDSPLLTVAAANNGVDAIRYILTHPDVNVNARNKYNETAIAMAAGLGNVEACQLLLQVDGLDLDLSRSTAHDRGSPISNLILGTTTSDDNFVMRAIIWTRSWVHDQEARRLQCLRMIDAAHAL